MTYTITMQLDILNIYPNPHNALESLRALMKIRIEANDDNPLNYIIQTINNGKSLMVTATFSEERKQHFLDHSL